MRELRKGWFKFLSLVLDIVFPPKCIFCNCIMPIRTKICICESCEEEVPFIKGKVCNKCGQPMEASAQSDMCLDCRRNPHEYIQGISVLEYKGKVKHTIVRLKFYGKKKYAEALGSIVANKIKSMNNWPSFDLIVYTPLHKTSYTKRGYNQAGLIAGTISKEMGVDIGKDVLLKIRKTKSQNKLTRAQRLINIKNAFSVNNRALDLVKDACILLVDDVYTTGTTVDECTRTLKKAGANKVFVVTAAIGRGRA